MAQLDKIMAGLYCIETGNSTCFCCPYKGSEDAGCHRKIAFDVRQMIESRQSHWAKGICSRCGFDWGKVAPIATVPNYCPDCGSDMRQLFEFANAPTMQDILKPAT